METREEKIEAIKKSCNEVDPRKCRCFLLEALSDADLDIVFKNVQSKQDFFWKLTPLGWDKISSNRWKCRSCDLKSDSPAPHQPEELKGNKFTWSEEKKKELEKICDNLNKRDSMEERFDKEFKMVYDNGEPWTIRKKYTDFIRKEKALSRAEGREEVLNAHRIFTSMVKRENRYKVDN